MPSSPPYQLLSPRLVRILAAVCAVSMICLGGYILGQALIDYFVVFPAVRESGTTPPQWKHLDHLPNGYDCWLLGVIGGGLMLNGVIIFLKTRKFLKH